MIKKRSFWTQPSFKRKFLCNLFFKGCKRLSCVVEILSFSHWADSYQYIRSNFPPTLNLQNYPLEIIEHVLQTVGASLERCLFFLLCNSNIQVQKWIFQKNLESYVEHNRELNFYLHSLNLKNRKIFLCFLSSFRLCWRTMINPKGGVPVAQERVGDSRYAWIELTCSTTWRVISLVCTKNSVNACWFNRIAIIDLTGRSFCVFLIQINVAFCHRWKQQANSLQNISMISRKMK